MNEFAEVSEFEAGNNKVYEMETFKTIQFMPRKQTDTDQGYIILLYRKVIQKKRTLGNISHRSCNSRKRSTSSTTCIFKVLLVSGLLGEVDSNINILELCSTYGQANNPALYKVKIKTTSKKPRYKVWQMR